MTSVSGSLCAVQGCMSNKRRNSNMSFFHLPANEERRKKWAELIGRPDLGSPDIKIKCHHVCALHFDKTVFTYIPKLRPTALPSKLLPNDPKPSISDIEITSKEISTQTDFSYVNSLTLNNEELKSKPKQAKTSDAVSSSSSRKRKHAMDSKDSNFATKLPTEIINIKQEPEEVEPEESAETTTTERFWRLINWHSKLRPNYIENRFDPEFELFTLNLYISNPHAYKNLKSLLSLPNETTLFKFTINIPPKLEDPTLEFLKAKLKALPENAKHCTLCVDDMMLKRFEKTGLFYAVVIMLRGIIVDWTQPIAYEILDSTKRYNQLQQWINDAVVKLLDAGIKVRAIVSNQDFYFEKYAKQVIKITEKKPYFFANRHKVYYIYNVPHLIKSIRDELMNNDFEYNMNNISWKQIEPLYSKKQEHKIKMIPNITETSFETDNLQLFRYSVSTGLNFLIFDKSLPGEAKATAEFVEMMNNLFNILNSNSLKSANKYQEALSLNEHQLDVLEESIEVFKNLKAIDLRHGDDSTKRVKAFTNMQVTIQAIMMLSKDLKEEGYNHILTSRLNLDCLDDFIKAVNQHGDGGDCRAVTVEQFGTVFSNLFISYILECSPEIYREGDICELINDNDFLDPALSNAQYLHKYKPATS